MKSTLLFAIIFYAALSCFGQQSTGTILGEFPHPNEPEVTIELVEISTGSVVEEVRPDTSGAFAFRYVPFAAYDVRAFAGDVMLASQRVTVQSAVSIHVALQRLKEYQLPEITVEENQRQAKPVETHTLYTARTIAELPALTGTKAIESVIINTSGVVPDEDGRLHVRGEDAQLQYVVDGIPITGNLTRVYSSLFNANIIKSIDIQTGGLNAEYGVETAGILDVTTKSGFDRPLIAHASGMTGSFDTQEGFVEVGGNINARSAAYLAAQASSSNRYLDPISSVDPIHDDGSSQSIFGKINHIITDGVDVNILGMYNWTKFSVPNAIVKIPPQDQRQDLKDYLVGARVNAMLGSSSLFSVLFHHRMSQAMITSGGLMQLSSPTQYARAIQENEKFFIGGKRKYTTTGGQVELSLQTDWFSRPNNFKVGGAVEVFPMNEFFTFAVTNPAVSNPDSAGGDDRYLAHDITQGGMPFLVNRYNKGTRYSAYVQDELRFDRWTIDAGIRFDAFNLIDKETAVSPRVGASYQVNDDLALRASYNRIVMQVPIENYLVSSSPEARQLTGAEQGSVPTNVQSERAHVFEVGARHGVGSFLDIDLAAYAKLIENMIVKVELGNSGVIFPVNLKEGFVAGGELRVLLREWNGFSGSLAFTVSTSRGRIPEDGSSPIAAGLILGEEGEAYSNPFTGEDMFPTEHDQLLTAALNLAYHCPEGVFASLAAHFDSGLPFDLTDEQGNGLNPEESRVELRRRGYSDDVIDLLNLESEMPGSPDKSVAPHVVVDVSAGYDFAPIVSFPVRLTFTVLNIFNTRYLYKFESQFGGTHFGLPRMFSGRIDVGI